MTFSKGCSLVATGGRWNPFWLVSEGNHKKTTHFEVWRQTQTFETAIAIRGPRTVILWHGWQDRCGARYFSSIEVEPEQVSLKTVDPKTGGFLLVCL